MVPLNRLLGPGRNGSMAPTLAVIADPTTARFGSRGVEEQLRLPARDAGRGRFQPAVLLALAARARMVTPVIPSAESSHWAQMEGPVLAGDGPESSKASRGRALGAQHGDEIVRRKAFP